MSKLFGKAKKKAESQPQPQPKPQQPAPPVFVSHWLRGVDVSHWEPEVDWVKAKASGIEFMFAKATEGIYYHDPMFVKHVKAAKAAGVLVGAYHFFHHSNAARAQFLTYAETVDSLGFKLDLPPVLDWEQQGGPKSQIFTAHEWLTLAEAHYGRKPMIYTGPSFMAALQVSPDFAAYPLWVAHYQTKAPRVPAPWKQWTIWQDSETGTVPGVTSHVDTNWYNGTLDSLRAL